MAGGGKRGGDRVLESRHLVGLFLGVVLLCGVFFTAAPAIPTAARTPQSRRFAPAATKVVARGPDRRGAHRARASPTA